MPETLTDSSLVTVDQAPAPRGRLRMSLGTMVGIVAVAATLFALGSQLSKLGGEGVTLAVGVVPMPVLVAVVIGCWKRRSAAHILGVISLSAILMLELIALLEVQWADEEFVLHFWIMLCVSITLALPLLVRRLVGEASGSAQARWLGFASVALGAGLNLSVIFVYWVLYMFAVSIVR